MVPEIVFHPDETARCAVVSDGVMCSECAPNAQRRVRDSAEGLMEQALECKDATPDMDSWTLECVTGCGVVMATVTFADDEE